MVEKGNYIIEKRKLYNLYKFKSSQPKFEKTYYLFPGVKIGIIIPAYNEMESIGKTLIKIPNNISDKFEVIVVNDGSKDDTLKEAKKTGVNIIDLFQNQGNGAAVRAGIEYFVEKQCDIVITLDADGQHNPEDIPKFIKPILANEADFLVGNRFEFDYNMEISRKVFSTFMGLFYSLMFRKRIKDPTNGYRAFAKRVLKNLELEANYSTIQEILFKVMPYYRFQHIGTKVSQRESGESFINYNKYFNRTIVSMIKYFILRKFFTKRNK